VGGEPWARVLALDGRGGAETVAAADMGRLREGARPFCVHLDPDAAPEQAHRCLAAQACLTPADADALMAEVRRSWVARAGSDGATLMGTLEGLPGDQVTGPVRWVLTRDLLILLADPHLPALADAEAALREGRGPPTLADLFVALIGYSANRASLEALEVDRRVADLEYRATAAPESLPLDELRAAQRDATRLRRRLTRHREMIRRLRALGPAWLMDPPARQWETLAREADETIEMADGAVERIHNADDDIQNRLSAMLNDRLYALTLVSWVVLPLSFVTGLLGVNVGGIPLNGRPWGFAILCAVLAAMGGAQYAIVRRLHWLPRQRRGAGPGA